MFLKIVSVSHAGFRSTTHDIKDNNDNNYLQGNFKILTWRYFLEHSSRKEVLKSLSIEAWSVYGYCILQKCTKLFVYVYICGKFKEFSVFVCSFSWNFRFLWACLGQKKFKTHFIYVCVCIKCCVCTCKTKSNIGATGPWANNVNFY